MLGLVESVTTTTGVVPATYQSTRGDVAQPLGVEASRTTRKL
jgi:hypothetical protein